MGEEPEIPEMASWSSSGEIFEPGARNASKRPPGGFLQKLFGEEPPGGLLPRLLSLGPEMFQNDLLEVSWRNFWAKSQKYLKSPPGGLLARLLSLGREMLQNGLLEASWTDFCARNQKCFKMPSWRLLERLLA